MEVLTTSTAKNSIEITLKALFHSDNYSSLSGNAAVLLSQLEFITPEIFGLFQAKGWIDKDFSFDEISKLLTKVDFYYLFPWRTNDHLRNFQLSEELLEEIKKVLLEYCEKEMSTSQENIQKYKIFFRQALIIHWQSSPEILGNWITTTIENRPWNEKEYDFLEPLLKKTYELINVHDYEKTLPGKFSNGVLLVCLGEINLAWLKENLATSYFDKAIQLFEKIEKLVDDDISEKEQTEWKENYQKRLITWYTTANLQRGRLYYEKNQFSKALERLLHNNEYNFNHLGNIKELGNMLQNLGDYLGAEKEWLKFQKYCETENDFNFYLLYELSRYYLTIGLIDDAILHMESHLALDNKTENKDLWHEAATAELAILRLKKTIKDNESNYNELPAFEKALLKCKEYFETSGNDKYNVTIYLWLANNLLYQQKPEKAISNLENGLPLMLKYFTPGNRIYYEYSIIYADCLKAVGLTLEYDQLINKLYDGICKDLGAHHPLICKLITRMQNLDTKDSIKLKKHYSSIERILNPKIWLDGFTPITLNDKKSIIAAIRKNKISILPLKDEDLELKGYQLPFYTGYLLLEITMTTASPELVRYYLYKDAEHVHLLDKTNKAIYKVAETDFCINTDAEAYLYIRFFMEFVAGFNGKFCIVENAKTDISWRFDISDNEQREQEEHLSKYIRPVTFLYQEEKNMDGTKFINWHFSTFIVFKDSLFSCKLEVNGKSALIRMYDDNFITAGLPVVIDFKSSLK